MWCFSHIVSSDYEKAAKILFKRSDPNTLEFAIQLAKKSENTDLVNAIISRYQKYNEVKEETELKTRSELFLAQALNENLQIKESDENLQIKESDENLQIKKNDKNLQTKESDENLQIKEDDKNLQIKESDENLQIKENDKNLQIKGNDENLQIRESDENLQIKESDENLQIQQNNDELQIQENDFDKEGDNILIDDGKNENEVLFCNEDWMLLNVSHYQIII